ncbi:MAG: hypothetical protein ACUVTO_05415 [Candidatus Caldatribacteriaceae bacterium]
MCFFFLSLWDLQSLGVKVALLPLYMVQALYWTLEVLEDERGVSSSSSLHCSDDGAHLLAGRVVSARESI